ncbi:F-box/kelch-repeat protein At4g19330-like [Selaginella moellendorffii]|uniref:F-box/kelch-repeat protein At4g19330-like n=1 Tax=Selaginella moellendorffii TaxID=88036 RepID=UPI000D1C30DF|nr:F-box/kelch-repeat protein At4g19330-like [Selaginella moellendorffii]|eukprot:XP_024520842.1 F-box/kelch-repeat protein At4g19330-like [Selaginella moellendorffii]
MEGQLYIVGGNSMGEEPDAEVYKPVEDRWDPLPLPPSLENRFHNALLVDDSKMVVTSCCGGPTFVFSARDLSWEVADLLGLQERHCCFVHSNQMYKSDKAGSLLLRYDNGKKSWEARTRHVFM